MAFYLLEYHLVDDYLERRPPLRAEHLGLVQEAVDRGRLVLGGALADPADRALIVWDVDDPAAVEAFVAADPYVQQGLVTRWTVRPWTAVAGTALPG